MLNPNTDCRLNTDLVFVLDESGSIGREDFQRVKTFVYNFTQNLLMGMSVNRVGVITFSSIEVEHIALNSSITKEAVLQMIRNLSYTGGGTNTALGLETMRRQDWRNDVSVLRLAVVVTDGISNSRSATLMAAERVHNHTSPILVYAIGVGENTDEDELKAIASGEQFLTHLDSFN